MNLIPIKTICPFCGGKMAMAYDYDVYVCENEHVVSGIEMEMIQDGKRATYEYSNVKGVPGGLRGSLGSGSEE